MKKVLIFLFVVSLGLTFSTAKDEKIVIPSSAIRYRIIANSNEFEDQEKKLMINTELEPIIQDILSTSGNINDSRMNIQKNLPKIEGVINKYTSDYTINYGMNYFPEKSYKGVSYEKGNYESLVITLGNGLGDNWWCVLFPPLCLLEAEETDLDDATYSFYFKNIIDKFNS
ncbi:MAG: stage II sporulation protein R [Bacilli bacterium]|nr:stage II sporulation protein R [Bacilli bacterium]